MHIGVCYFPEHWDESTWRPAIARMADAGIDYVRMGEFAWGALEPSRGTFDFEWLDTVLDLVAEYDMQTLLCTPTATPPKWLVDERPSILRQTLDGTVEGYGSRREYCFNSEAYREESDRIVRRVAERYVDRDVVKGWQIDNEYGCHGTVRCYCDECAAAFRDWLRERYDAIDDLNQAWGTAFWSQQYNSFEAVEPPRPTPSAHHPSLLLEYYRFASDSVVDYNERQVEILREANDDWLLAHNLIGEISTFDAWELTESLDVVAWDSYPTGFPQTHRSDEATLDELRAGNPDQLALNHALCRGLSSDPFWVMEQQPGDINWSPHSPQPGQGAMRLWALQATAHGADVISYFRWRAASQGQEQYHSGLRTVDGAADRGYHDAAAAATDLESLPAADQPHGNVALLHDYENVWTLHEQRHAPEFEYWEHVQTYVSALRARGVTVDVRHPADTLADYDAVVAPTLHLVDDDLADHLTEYVVDGGHLLLTIRSGVKDAYNKVHEGTAAPGPLVDLVGTRVDERETLPGRAETPVTYDGSAYEYRTWAEWLSPTTATTAGTYAHGPADDRPAITTAETGDGTATYVGVWPKAELADVVVTDLLDRAAVARRDEPLPDGVRIASRGTLTVCSNFTDEPVTITGLDPDDILIGDTTIDAYDAVITSGDPDELTIR